MFSEYSRCFGNGHTTLREAPASTLIQAAKKFAASLKIEKQELLAEVRMTD